MIKKILMLFSFMVLFMAINCDNEPYEGEINNPFNLCEQASLTTLEAANNFSLATPDDYNILCQTYRDALEDQIQLCGDDTGELQVLIDNLGNCIPIGQSLCELATAASDLALEQFANTTNMEYEANCMAYVEALENQILICGDDGSLRALINELGDCELTVFDVTGNWKLVSITSDIARDLDNDGNVSNDYLDEYDCFTNETVDFNTDGTGTFYFRSYTEVQIEAAEGTFDEVDYIVTCIDDVRDVDFTWEQIGLNIIEVTINSDGTILNFFRNGDNIFLARRDDFIATSISPNVESIIEDLIYEYIKL